MVIKNYCVKIIKMEFDNLYAKSELKLIVNNDIAGNMLNHAYLLCGQDDVLLNYFAKEFAKHILCDKAGCGACSTCGKIKCFHSVNFLLRKRTA